MKKRNLLLTLILAICLPWVANGQSQLNEGFESTTFPPEDWASIHVSGANYWARYTTYKHSGDASAYAHWASSGHQNYLITPKLAPASGESLSFFVSAQSYSGTTLYVKVSTTTADASAFSTTLATYTTGSSGTIGTTSPSTWVEKTIDLSDYVGQQIFIAFHVVDNNGGDVIIDDVTGVTLYVASCAKPTLANVNPETIEENQASVQWTENGSATNWVLEYSTAADFTNPTSLTQSGIPAKIIDGLNPGTTYYVRVKANCGGGDESDWSNVVSFTTLCGAYDIPYTYGFEEDGPFACWTPISGVTRQTSYVNNGSYSLKFSGTTSNMIALPQFTDATNTLRVEFWTRPESNSAPGTYSNYSGKFAVGYMTDMTDASTFVAVETYNSTEMTTSYVKKTVDLTNAPAGANIAMRQFDCATNYYWFVDDVTVKEIPSCLAPTGLAVSTTATGFRFTWDAEQGAQWGYSLSLAGEQHGATMSVGTNNYMDINIGQSYCGVAVDYNTDYVFYVSKNCGGGDLSEDASIAFRTPCNAYDIPYTYDFETETPFGCWTPIAGVAIQNSSSNSHESTYSLKFSGTTNNMVALPQFNEATNNLRVEFWTRPESTGGSSGKFAIGYMTDISNANTFVAVDTYNSTEMTTNYVKKTVDLANVPANANIAMRQFDCSTVYYWYVDDVTVKEIPSCLAPSGLAANASTTSAELSWTANSGETEWTVYYKKTTDENYTAVPNVDENPYTLPGLTAANYYEYYVVANCSTSDVSEPSEVYTFVTECEAITALGYTENFDDFTLPSAYTPSSRTLPVCWNYINECTYSTYMYYPTVFYYSSTNYANSTPNCLRLYSSYSSYTDYDPKPQYAIMPEMEGLAGKQITLKARGYNTSSTFKVGLMTDPADASTFTEITNSENPASMTTSYQTYTFIIPSDATAHYVAIMIEAANSSRTTNMVYIDDIEIDEAPTCFQPQNLAVTAGSITAHEATLTWQPNSNGTENAWVLQCCVDDEFMCGDAGIFEVSGTPSYTLTGFEPETTYYVRVKPDCDTEGELWSEVVSFTTLALCPAPTNFAVASVNAHTARFQWQGTSESYSVSYRTAASIDALYEEHFTGLTSGIPTGWDNSEGTTTTDSYKWSYYNSGHDAAPCVRFNSFNNGNGNTNFLKTPSMDFPAFTTMILSFWWKNPTGGDFSVYISTDGGATRALLKEGMTGQSTWKQETIILSDYVGASNVFIYFKGTSNWGNGDAYIYLDDVVLGSEVAAGDWQTFTGIEESPYTIEGLLAETTYEAKIQGNCGDLGLSQETEPITFTTGIACYPPLGATYYPEDLKSDQVELYWNGGDGTHYQLCLNGDEDHLIDVEGTVYTWEGLTPETEYTVKVRSNCELSYPGDGVSEWSGTLTFTTLPDCAQPDEITFQAINHYDATLSWMGDSESFTVNYRTTAGIDGIEEEFGTSLPSGWQNKTGLLSSVLEGTALGSSTQWYFGSNNGVFDNHARINIYGNTRYGWLITPEITLASGAVFNFDLALTAYSGTGAASGTCDDDRFVVLVYANEAWTILREWNNSGSADVFNNIPTAGTNVSIDLSAYIGQTVKIAFYGESTEGGNGDNNLHIDNVMIGTPIAAGEWQTVTTNQARATIEDLTPGTEYEVVVVPSCDETAASDPVNFTTIDENKKIFILPGDWSTASNWMDNEIPTIDDDVTLRSNATITGDAFANSITGTGTGLGTFTLTIEDGGSLACNSHVDDVTMKKTIHAYPTEAGNRAGYYLIAQPNMSGTAPTNLGMITTESDYDLFAFNYEYEGAEWRNYKVQSFNLEYCKGYLYANAADVELSYTGLVRESKTGIYTMANYDDEDEYSFNGWTLVGNPFPCKATVSLGSSSMHYYRMNETGDDYIADNGPINPWEGIFAQTPNQTYRVTFYRYEGTKASSSLNINLSLGGKLNVRDRAVVRFDEGNTLEKMQFNPNHSKVFIPQDGKDYAVVVAEGNVGEIPVNFKAESNGSYTLSFTSEEVSFSYLHLIDNKTGNDVNLLQTPYYTFDASTSDYESRFRLMFATGSSVNDDNFGFVNASGNFCIFGLEGEATLQVIDVLGHVLSTEQFSGSYEKRLNVAPGVYMIRLIQGNDIKVQKMVVR